MNSSMNPNSELSRFIVNGPDAVSVPESLIHVGRQFQQIMMMYTCAIREVRTKLEVLNDELSIRNQRNPIEMIKARVKKPESIVEKLHRRGFPITGNTDAGVAGSRRPRSWQGARFERRACTERKFHVRGSKRIRGHRHRHCCCRR